MIQQEQKWEFANITDQRVMEAMQAVRRRRFVPDDLVREASQDRALPIGSGQTISQPLVVATMTEALQPRPDHRVLEVGAGSGYQAAVLAKLVQNVYSIEIDPDLARKARERLKKLGYANVEIRVGDGYDGWIEHAPFDGIIITAAANEVPPPLMDQLKNGGRMVIPLGTPYGPQELTVIEKHHRGISTRKLMPVRFVTFRRSLN